MWVREVHWQVHLLWPRDHCRIQPCLGQSSGWGPEVANLLQGHKSGRGQRGLRLVVRVVGRSFLHGRTHQRPLPRKISHFLSVLYLFVLSVLFQRHTRMHTQIQRGFLACKLSPFLAKVREVLTLSLSCQIGEALL